MDEQTNTLKYWLIKIWPTIYRYINLAFFDTLQFIKYVFRLIVKQIKGEY